MSKKALLIILQNDLAMYYYVSSSEKNLSPNVQKQISVFMICLKYIISTVNRQIGLAEKKCRKSWEKKINIS